MPLPSLNDLFVQAIKEHDKPASLMFKRDGKYQSLSSSELFQKVQQVTAGLASLGVEKGTKIALLSENRPEWMIADLGMLALGAINVPIYSTLPPSQIEALFNDAEVSLAFISSNAQLAKVRQIASNVPSLRQIILFDPTQDPPELDSMLIPFNLLIQKGIRVLEKQPSFYLDASRRVGPEDLASIIYTSGTTGNPKGVMLSHGNIVSNVLACSEALQFGRTDVTLSFLPLCHILERTAEYLMIHRGTTIAFAESAETVPQNMLEIRPTIVPSVPRLFEKMFLRIQETISLSSPVKRKLMQWSLRVGREHSQRRLKGLPVPMPLMLKGWLASRLVFTKLQNKLGGRLRFFISGGAPLDPALAEFFHSAGILILEGYGLTETSPVIAVNRENDFRIGSVGKPVSSVEVKLAEDGEILVRGASVMQGYYRMEDATREVFSGGWLHTGDIGATDSDGFLYVTDRKKDLIVTASGKNIAPQKVEGLLKKCPFVQNIVVIGDRRPFVVALVVPNREKVQASFEGTSLNCMNYSELLCHPALNEFLMEKIQEYSGELAQFERVKKIALLEKDFSIEGGDLTPSLKVRRRAVESRYGDLIESLYT